MELPVDYTPHGQLQNTGASSGDIKGFSGCIKLESGNLEVGAGLKFP